jgi:hypothetical protein
LAKRENTFLEGKNLKLARDDTSEVPAARDHARVIVSIVSVFDAPRSSSYQALAEITRFMHYNQYGPNGTC